MHYNSVITIRAKESIIRNWLPTRCNFWFTYLYPISSTCFGRCFRPSSGALDCIYSFWYCPPLLLLAGVVDVIELHLVHDTGRQQHRWTVSKAVNTVKGSWWWAKTSPETRRTDWVQISKPKVASCWSSVTNYTNDARIHKHHSYKRASQSLSDRRTSLIHLLL